MSHEPSLKPEERTKELPTIENRVTRLERQIVLLEANLNAMKKLAGLEDKEAA